MYLSQNAKGDVTQVIKKFLTLLLRGLHGSADAADAVEIAADAVEIAADLADAVEITADVPNALGIIKDAAVVPAADHVTARSTKKMLPEYQMGKLDQKQLK